MKGNLWKKDYVQKQLGEQVSSSREILMQDVTDISKTREITVNEQELNKENNAGMER